jgi:hypothetical protein
MNDDLRPRVHDGVAKRSGIEHIDDNATNASGVELTCSLDTPRAAGDIVSRRKQERRQPPANRAARAREKYSHAITSRRATSLRALQPLQGFGDLGFAQLCFLALLLLFFDDLLWRARDKVRIAKLGVDARDIGVALRHLFGESGALGGKIDNALERQGSDIAAHDKLHGSSWRGFGEGNLADAS